MLFKHPSQHSKDLLLTQQQNNSLLFIYHLGYYFYNPAKCISSSRWFAPAKRGEGKLRIKGAWNGEKRSVNQHDLQSGTNPKPFFIQSIGLMQAPSQWQQRSRSLAAARVGLLFQHVIIISIFALSDICQMDPPQISIGATQHLCSMVWLRQRK